MSLSNSSPHPAINSPRACHILSWISMATGCLLAPLTIWYIFYLLGAEMTKGSVYTGPVGATNAVYFLCGLTLSLISTFSAYLVYMLASKGSQERARTWRVWLGSHTIFIMASIAGGMIINCRMA